MAAYYSQTQPPNLLTYQYYPPQQPPPPPQYQPIPVIPPPPGAPLPPPHHLHPQYIPQQQQQPHVYDSYIPSPLASTNDVRTLFIAGLPEDVKPREIYNLFREFPGYESSHLRSPNNSSQV